MPRSHTAEMWLLECQRVSREVQRIEPSLERMRKIGAHSLLARASFQSALVARVLHDPAQKSFPPNQFQSARFWIAMVEAIRAEMEAAATSAAADSAASVVKLHPELAAKETESRALIESDTEEDVFSGWYRNYTVAACCDDRTTSTLDGATSSVLVLPEAEQRVYPFRVETGCLASSIGLVMWPAGFLLCEFALDNPELFRGKRVLELGAGIGLTSTILATFTQPSAIVATDFDVRALKNIHHNFECNGLLPKDTPFVKPDESNPATYTSAGVSPAPLSPFPAAASAASSTSPSSSSSSSAADGRCEVMTACVDWYSFSVDQLRAFDAEIIIACDTTYVAEILVPFARTVRAALEARPNAVCFLAQAERHPSTFMLYLDSLREEGLALQELPTNELHKRFNYDRITTPVALHRVTLASSKSA